MKSSSGVYVNEPSESRASVPRSVPSTRTDARASPSGSASLARTPGATTVRGASSPVAYASGRATGASFTGVTVTETVAVAVPPFPSEAV